MDRAIALVSIEKGRRTGADSLLVYACYAADYILLWGVIGLIIEPYEMPLTLTLPFFVARLAAALLFIAMQRPLFLLLDKAMILAKVLTVEQHDYIFELSNIALEVLMCLVWTLSKEQRQTHLDSRLGYGLTFFKQLLILAIVATENSLAFMHGLPDKNFLTLSVVVGLFIVDLSEFYYY
jgi:hypothetical protein